MPILYSYNMSIELKRNDKLDLEIPEFTCDHNPLGEHLNAYPMLSNLNGYKFTGIIGRPGQGKTSLMVSFLTGKGKNKVFRKVFHHVLLVMPSTSRGSLKKNIFEKHSPDKMFEELDLPTIESIYDKLLKASEKGEKSLLILDDVGASLKDKEIQTILRKIIYNRRHLKVHIVLLLQSYLSCPKEIRKLYSNIFLYKPSKVEFENLFNELFETKKDLAIDILNFAFDKPHDFMMLNVESQQMYRGFDEIIVHQDDDEK
jgi:hypothetical protein